MSRLSAVLLVVYTCLGLASASEIYTLFEVESILINQLEEYIEKSLKKQEEIKRFLDYVDVLHDDIGSSEDYYGNPINAFTTISRFVKNWQREIINPVLLDNNYSRYREQLEQTLQDSELKLPTQQDLLKTTSELLEVQAVSRMPTEQLVETEVFYDPESEKNVTISASECYVIGRNAHILQQYESAAEWLLHARSLAFHEAENFPSVEQLDILKQLAPSLLKLGNYKLARKLNNEILKAEPEDEEALKIKPLLENLLLLERVNKLSLQSELQRAQEEQEEQEEEVEDADSSS